MKQNLFLLALAALAALAPAQTPTETYAKAERQQHNNEAAGRFTSNGAHDYDLPLWQGNLFRVQGSTNQDLPWGLNWQNLCDNSWIFTKEYMFYMNWSQTFHQIDDYYTIDHGYVDPSTGDPDQSNGDDIIVAGTATWIRTCTSVVTNDITYTITSGGGGDE